MSVTLNFHQLKEQVCLPKEGNIVDYNIQPDRDVLFIAGNTFSITLRVTAGDSIDVIDIDSLGVLRTRTVHGLSVNDPIHICFYSGVSRRQITPWLKVLEVMDSHSITLSDANGEKVVIEKELLFNEVESKQPKI
ncbi:MAG: hypothetical protein ACRDBG_27355, partial [Waterburya sp.]